MHFCKAFATSRLRKLVAEFNDYKPDYENYRSNENVRRRFFSRHAIEAALKWSNKYPRWRR